MSRASGGYDSPTFTFRILDSFLDRLVGVSSPSHNQHTKKVDICQLDSLASWDKDEKKADSPPTKIAK
jgi:hypothetical protein